MSADGVDRGSDLLLDCPRGDGLVYGPVEGFDEPGVAAEPDFLGSGVDALDEFVGESERYLLHDGMVSGLTSDIVSDIISDMSNPENRIGLYRIVTYTSTTTGARVVSHEMWLNGQHRASVTYPTGTQAEQPSDTWGEVLGDPFVESRPTLRHGQMGVRTWVCRVDPRFGQS